MTPQLTIVFLRMFLDTLLDFDSKLLVPVVMKNVTDLVLGLWHLCQMQLKLPQLVILTEFILAWGVPRFEAHNSEIKELFAKCWTNIQFMRVE